MKKAKKILVLALIVALAATCFVLLTGCKKEDPDTVLVVATSANFPPFEYKEGNEFVGVDMDIAKDLAAYLGMELQIMDMDFDGVVTSVGKNNVDIAMAGLTVNEKRKESVNFSDTYYNASQVIIVLASDTTFDGKTLEEIEAILASKTETFEIGVQAGTTGEYYVKGDEDWGFDGYDVTCKGFTNAGLAIADMKNGGVDIVIVDEAPAKYLAASIEGVKVIDVALTVEEYAFGVNKNDPELLKKVNEYLAKIKSDGTLDAIMAKYFGNAA